MVKQKDNRVNKKQFVAPVLAPAPPFRERKSK
jgi:hypothetical protein